MVSVAVRISDDLKSIINELPWINWSELAREEVLERAKRHLLLKKLDKMLEKSELTEEDCLRLGEKVKEGMWKRYKEEGW